MKPPILVIHATLGVLLCGITLLAQQATETQAPRDPVIAEQESSQPQTETAEPQQGNDASENVPPPITDEVGSQELNSKTEQEDENLQIQRELVALQNRLFWLGAIQAVILFVQAIVFVHTLRAIRRQADLMELSAKLAIANAKTALEDRKSAFEDRKIAFDETKAARELANVQAQALLVSAQALVHSNQIALHKLEQEENKDKAT